MYASACGAMQKAGITNQLTNLSVTRAGDSTYTLSPPRWGDYSGASADPSDGSVWLGAEYATGLIPGFEYWGTAITQVSP
jgi:hypothetical protein